jgi:OOP family OmpA-OmpF porin
MTERQVSNLLLAIGATGLLALSVLTLWFGPHSAERLERQVSTAASEALAAGGFEWARATAYGQRVVLEGVAPTDQEKASAVEAVRGAKGVQKVAATALEVAPVVSPFRIVARKDKAGVTLEGVVPNRLSMKEIDEAAHTLFGNTLTIKLQLASGVPAGVDWTVATIQGLDALKRLDQGAFDLTGTRLTVSGLARDEAVVADIRDKMLRAGGGITATVTLTGPPEWTARFSGGGLTFEGKSPSKWTQGALAAATGLPDSRIADRSVAGGSGDWQKRAMAALPYLARFKSGAIEVQGKEFRISGEAPASSGDWLREDMARISDGFTVVYALTDAAPQLDEIANLDFGSASGRRGACEEAFKRVLGSRQIVFANRTARLQRASGPALDAMLDVARRCPDVRFEVQGYTDAQGRKADNIRLSGQRAGAVKDWLAAHGIPADRLSSVGYGPDRPVATNRTERGRAQNRRIEIRVTGGE